MSEESGDDGSADDGAADGWSFDDEPIPVSDSETAAGADDEPPAEPSDAEPSVGERSDAEHSDADRADADRVEDDEYEPSVAGVFGARPEDAPPRPEIVPESPDLENVLFLLVGVLLGLFVIYRAVVVFSA